MKHKLQKYKKPILKIIYLSIGYKDKFKFIL